MENSTSPQSRPPSLITFREPKCGDQLISGTRKQLRQQLVITHTSLCICLAWAYFAGLQALWRFNCRTVRTNSGLFPYLWNTGLCCGGCYDHEQISSQPFAAISSKYIRKGIYIFSNNNSHEPRYPTSRGRGGWGDRPPKPTKVTLFTMIFYNTENNIRDISPFCSPLFCHSSVVKYTSYLLQ